MKRLVSNGDHLENVAKRTSNIVIQRMAIGSTEQCVILGAGHSLSVDKNNFVSHHDPGMSLPDTRAFKHSTVFSLYFTFESSGLESSSRDLADFINSCLNSYDKIILIGHSKCGVCFANCTHLIENQKVTLITVSAPYKGTIIADKSAFEKDINWFVRKIYEKIFSNHNVDKDIAPNSDFIRNMHRRVNCKYINIVSSISKITDCRSIVDFFLYILNNYKKIDGDGIVPKDSQDNHFYCKNQYEITASHASSLQKSLKFLDDYIFL